MKRTGDMRGVFELVGKATGGRVVDKLLDEVDVGEATFSELAHDAETILIDPGIASVVNGVVERV